MARRAAPWLLAAMLATPAALAGQVIVGTVIEGGSDRPVTGAMVRLFTEQGPAGPRYLTAGDGAYRLRASQPGSYWLGVERIGFAAFRRGPVEVAAGETVTLDLEVATEPVRLQGLDVETAARSCSLRGEEGDETQLVWDEARKALAAATWTEREAGLRFTVEERVRSLDPRGRTVTDEVRGEARIAGGNSVRSLPPEELVREGYVREVDGLVYYYGPDAEVLLSDAFLDTHCFRVVPGPEDRTDLVGLSFEPVPDRDTTDIEGVLLLDRTTSRLERVEFAYTGLHAGPGRDQAGGTVRFLELADGRWVVRAWHIRAPIVVLRRSVGSGGQLVERLAVESVREFGSEVRSVEGPGGVSWRADQPVGRLRGMVYDSIRDGALSGADVHLAGGGWRATADGAGRWELDGIPPGRYRVSFGHRALDSMGVEPGWKEVTVGPDSVTEVQLAVPPLGRLLALECPERGNGVVVGVVRDGVGRTLSGVEVRVAGGEPADASHRAVTDDDGFFRLCGLPPDREMAVAAALGPVGTAPETVRTRADFAVRADLWVDAVTETRDRVREPAGRPALTGTVVQEEDGTPVDGALVELATEDGEMVGRHVTGEDGRFRIFPDLPGAYRLRVERIGYGPVADHPVEVPGATKRVEVHLASEAVAVEGVVVEVTGRSRRPELSGFYERQAQGAGILLDRTQLEALNLVQTGDIVNRVGSLAALPQGTRGSMDTNRRFVMFRRAARGSGCMPAIFVDGNLIRQGGEWRQAMPTLDELIPVDEVEALELYEGPASTPPRFGSMGAACGVIAIWSRSTDRPG